MAVMPANRLSDFPGERSPIDIVINMKLCDYDVATNSEFIACHLIFIRYSLYSVAKNIFP